MRKPDIRKGGFVLLELIIVLAVIAILAGGYFSRSNNPKDETSTYQMTMGRSNDAACKANRAAFRSTVEIFRMNHPGEAVNTENLKKAGVNFPTCPQGGAYGILPDGSIICSKHPDK